MPARETGEPRLDPPEGWREASLDILLVSLESGSRPKGGVRGIKEGVPSIGGEHLDEAGGFRVENVKFVPHTFFKTMNRGHISLGDVLVVKDGATTGKVALVRSDFPHPEAVVNEHVFICRPTGAVLSPYLFMFLFSAEGQERILENFQGSAQGGINQGFARETTVPVAPLAEQERIVANVEKLLARVNASRERLARVPAILKRFRQAVLAAACEGRLSEDWRARNDGRGARRGRVDTDFDGQQADLPELPVGWKWRSLGDLILEGPQNGLYKPRSAYGSGTPIVRIEDYQDGSVRSREQLSRLQVTKSEVSIYGLRPRDILVNRVNSPSHLGKCLVVQASLCPAVFESNMMRFRLSDAADPDFVLRYLASIRGRAALLADAKWAVNQASINQADVKGTRIPMPSMVEQIEIVRRVEALFKVADAFEKRVATATARAEKLTQAILAKAFRGELVPTEAELARREERDYEPTAALLERIRSESARADTKGAGGRRQTIPEGGAKRARAQVRRGA
jgi:type I restriction enzyme S subunit